MSCPRKGNRNEEIQRPEFIPQLEWFYDGDGHPWMLKGFNPEKGTVTLQLVNAPSREIPLEDLRKHYRSETQRRAEADKEFDDHIRTARAEVEAANQEMKTKLEVLKGLK